MDVKQLIYFMEVYKELNFTKASKNLFITQQGLSSAVSKLEEELNTRFFIRGKNHIEVTEAGEKFYYYACNLVSQFKQVEDYFKHTPNETNTIRMAISRDCNSALPFSLLECIHSTRDCCSVESIPCGSIDADRMVSEGSCDIALTLEPIDSKKFCKNYLCSFDLGLVVPKSNPLSEQKSVSIQALQDIPLCIIDNSCKLHHLFKQQCTALQVSPHLLQTQTSFSKINDFIHENPSFGGISCNLSPDILNYDDLKMIPITDFNYSFKINLIYSKTQMLHPAAMDFLNSLLLQGKQALLYH